MAVKKEHKRAIRATLHRLKGKSSVVIWERYYASISSALKRGVELAILEGQPGDVLELTHSNFDFLIATLKLKVSSNNLASMDIKFHIENLK